MSAIGEVSAKLAHEILNPLAGIKAAVQLLARGRPVEDGAASTVVRDTAQLMSQKLARRATCPTDADVCGLFSPGFRRVRWQAAFDSRRSGAHRNRKTRGQGASSRKKRRCHLSKSIKRLSPVLTNFLVNTAQASRPAATW